MDGIILGTELKLRVDIETPTDEMDKVGDIEIQFIGGNKKSVKSFTRKEEVCSPGLTAVEGEPLSFICALSTKDVGVGKIICRTTVNLEDGYFTDDNIRTEIVENDTGIIVVKGTI